MISLTALTGGIAPAFAKPDTDPAGPTTTVVAPEPEVTAPEPDVTAPEPEQVKPEKPAEAPAPAAPVVPPSQPSVQLPSQAEAPEPPAAVESEPETQAPQTPKTAVAPPVTSVEPAEPSEQEPTTVQQAPQTSTAPSSARLAPETPSAPVTASESNDSPETSVSSVPSAALAPASDPSQAPASTSSATPTSASAGSETEAEKSGDESTSEPATSSVSPAAREIETVEPQTLQAPEKDVQLAKSSKPVVIEEQPAPAAKQDVAAFSNSIETSLKIPGLDIGASAKADVNLGRGRDFARDRDFELVSNVRQWRRDWIEYDEFYRPIILNPFRAPVRIVYIYDFRPRILYIPPLARLVLEVAQFAAYSFTAAVLNPINAAIDTVQALSNIAVGSFFGGGYLPGIGQPFPAPPRVLRYDNVPVLVNYSNARYEPFRVRQIVDVGDDRQYGERKVLLDGVTPAWGTWTQTATGERQFEVHKTQQFPGLDAPSEAPLPGDYRLQLAADESPSSGLTGRDIFLFVTAGVIGTLGFGAIGLALFLGRRRPQH